MTQFITGIDHVQLVLPKGEEEKARAFYGTLLGLEEIPKPENLRHRGGCWFVVGEQELHLGVLDPFHAPKKAHPGFTVQSIGALSSRLQAAGVEMEEEEPIEGRSRLFTKDPFGNRLEFLEYHG